ncbi:MAG: AsmA family protein [Pseudomonadota bacterium]
MRWVFRIALVLVFAGLMMGTALLLLPGDRIARIAADRISALTGREVTLEGETRISFYPVLGISTGAITIANAQWADETPLFYAESLKIGVEPQAFWGGEIRITGLEAIAPSIDLRRRTDGSVNWQLGVEGVAASGQTAAPDAASNLPRSRKLALTLNRALIKDASLSYRDAQTGVDFEQTGVDLDLRWPNFQGAASFDLGLRPGNAPLSVSGNLDRVGDFIEGGISALTATLTAPEGRVSFSGNVRAGSEAQGDLEVDISDSATFFTALGGSAPGLSDGLGRESIGFRGNITLTEEGQKLAVRKAVLRLDENRLTGAADVDLTGDTPSIQIQLRTDALDLSGSSSQSPSADTGGAVGAAPANGPEAGWSRSPMDFSRLGAVEGGFAILAESVDLGDLKLGKTRVVASLERSRLVFDLREIRAYGGLVTGEFVINNRSGLSVGGKMNARGIALEPFLNDAMDVSRLSGSADAQLRFLGVGDTMHAIMHSLSGEGEVKTGRGVVSGFDLDRVMRGGAAGNGTTVFDNLNATFTLDRGQLLNDDLRLSLPLASASGSGRIGLGPQDIDYRFIPQLLDNDGSNGLAIPVTIRGSWANPQVQPDLEAAIELNLNADREALEREARDLVDEVIQKELGLEVREGQSLEDAAIEALENELERGLRNLFE